jgi:hypothetical protein
MIGRSEGDLDCAIVCCFSSDTRIGDSSWGYNFIVKVYENDV